MTFRSSASKAARRSLDAQSLEDLDAIVGVRALEINTVNTHHLQVDAIGFERPFKFGVTLSGENAGLGKSGLWLLHHEDAANTFHAAKSDVVEHGILDLTKELIFLNLDFLIIILPILGRKTRAPDD